jgi:solute:Na+ symporter, SSS family
MLLWLSSAGLIYFILSLLDLVPSQYGSMNLDFLLYCILFVFTLLIMVNHQMKGNKI